MNKKINIIMVLSFLLIVLLGGSYTYSRYRTESGGIATADVANWNITVNGCDIVNPDPNNLDCFLSETDDEGNVTVKKNFSVTEIHYDNKGNTSIVDNKIGPGSRGWFDIVIKPNDTEVSMKYLLKLTFHKNGAIKFFRSNPNDMSGSMTRMEEEGYNGTLLYSSNGFKMKSTDYTYVTEVKFRIYVEWTNDESGKYDEEDTEIGTNGSTPTLDIPISIEFEQIK